MEDGAFPQSLLPGTSDLLPVDILELSRHIDLEVHKLVIGIGHGDDSCPQRDLFFGQLIRVPLAIILFVVAPDHQPDMVQVVDELHCCLARLRVVPK